MITLSGCMKYKLLFSILLLWILLPFTTHAAEFVGLVGIPGIEPTGDTDLNAYINALYRLSISIAALLAVVKIVAAGAKYMLSDIITHKEEAKKDIQGALIGLLIVIGAIIILNTINTDLTRLNLTVATTTIQQGPTFQEVIAAQQRAFEDRAAALGSQVVVGNCESAVWGVNGFDMLPGETEEQACRRVCTGPTLRGQFIDNWVGDQCRYVEAVGAQCVPNSNRTCCEGIHRASWDAQTQTCSGVAEARAGRKLECAEQRRIWNEQLGYCGAARCNLNTDANCCSATGGSIQNGVCSATGADVTTEQDCINRGAGWAYVGGTCRQQNVEQFDFRDVPADIANNINAAYQYCSSQGEGWEFNENAQPPRCQRFNGN